MSHADANRAYPGHRAGQPLHVSRGTDAAERMVTGGHHVTTLLHTDHSRGALDVVRVCADAGDAHPPHRHGFGQWFYLEQGAVRITGWRDGGVTTLGTLEAGDSVWVPPDVWHAMVNASAGPARIIVVGVPGIITSYFDRAGIVGADETQHAQTPLGPAQLADLASDHGIVFAAS